MFLLQSITKKHFIISVEFLLNDTETNDFLIFKTFNTYPISGYLLNTLSRLFYLILTTTLMRMLSVLYR